MRNNETRIVRLKYVSDGRSGEYRLGHLIRGIRDKRGMTAVEVARKAKISTAMMSLMENGERFPSVDTLIDILDALDHELQVVDNGRE